MKSVRRSTQILLALISLTLTACAPKVTSSLPVGGSLPLALAVLPPDYSGDIPRERVDIVHDAIVQELRNRNFLVADQTIMSNLCSAPSCPERSEIARNYLIDGFVTVKLDSFSRNNFIAGYYNQLQGSVSITDTKDAQLISVSHTENESGGVLLQSGQVFQGILSQIRHSGDEVFDDLSERFAHQVVEKLPAPSSSESPGRPESTSLALTAATAELTSPSTYTVCAHGTPHSFAYLLLGTTRTPLREVSPGRYCRVFSSLVSGPSVGAEAIELRTAFGNSAREAVSIPSEPPCALKDRVTTVETGRAEVLCTTVGEDNSTRGKGCSSSIPHCGVEKILIYQASQTGGPYQKVSEQRTASIKLPQASTVAILAVGKGQVPSQPIVVEATK
jgi:hypothetical protein